MPELGSLSTDVIRSRLGNSFPAKELGWPEGFTVTGRTAAAGMFAVLTAMLLSPVLKAKRKARHLRFQPSSARQRPVHLRQREQWATVDASRNDRAMGMGIFHRHPR